MVAVTPSASLHDSVGIAGSRAKTVTATGQADATADFKKVSARRRLRQARHRLIAFGGQFRQARQIAVVRPSMSLRD